MRINDLAGHLKNCALSPVVGVQTFARALNRDPLLLQATTEELERLNALEQSAQGNIAGRCVISARSKQHIEQAMKMRGAV